jgi:Transposase DDE domain group 1
LRRDPLLAVLAEKPDPRGENRARQRDRGKALAGKSTLNRLELTAAVVKKKERYKKIPLEMEAVDRLLVEIFLEAHQAPPAEIVLDLDATDDPLHGNQEGDSSTATTGTTAICRCKSLREIICCARVCGLRTSMPRRAV